jgi:GxxExxY protein
MAGIVPKALLCCQRKELKERHHEGHEGTRRKERSQFGKASTIAEQSGTYGACLQFELKRAGHESIAQLALPVVYCGVKLDVGYRIDLLVDDRVIVEIKSVDAISPIHHAQIITYLKLSGKSVGLLINFNVVHLKDGIKRFVNGTDWK